MAVFDTIYDVDQIPEPIRNRCLHAALTVVQDVLRDEGFRLDWLGRCELLDVALRGIVAGYDRPEVREN